MNLCASTCIALLGFVSAAAAGPLAPPAGAIASTHKTLTEVEPRTPINAANTPGDSDSLYRITQPGSYYLTGNITGVAGKHGIEIASSGVTIDLNGFDLMGVAGMGNFDGITATVNNVANIAVFNGSVRGWGGDGIDLATVATRSSVLTDVRSSSNAGVGIRISTGSTMTRCAANQNTAGGISADLDNTITHCTAHQNAGFGMSVGFAAVVTQCSMIYNTTNGLNVANGSVVRDCVVTDNSGLGIAGESNWSGSGCIVSSNANGGIRCVAGCVIRDNSCSGNGLSNDGAGIIVTNSDCRIERNNCTANRRGIQVTAPGNIIVCNTCSGNTTTNWDIAANNVYGPIIDRSSPASPAVNGNSAADTTGSTHPNANFTY